MATSPKVWKQDLHEQKPLQKSDDRFLILSLTLSDENISRRFAAGRIQ